MPAPVHITHRRASTQARVIVIVLMSAVVLYGFYALSKFGPTSVEKPLVDSGDLLRISRTAQLAETEWANLVARRTEEKAEFTEADLAVIDKAVDAIVELEKHTQPTKSKLTELRQTKDNLHGLILRKASIAHERNAIAFEAAEEPEKAAAEYRLAYEMEKRIDTEFPLADIRKQSRTEKLQVRVRHTSALPLWEKSLTAEEDGDDFAASKKMNEAATAYQSAIALQTELDRDFRGLTPADYRRTRTLDRKLANAQTYSLRERVDSLVVLAEAEATGTKHDKLASLRDEFETILSEISRKYPDAEYADASRIAPLRRRMIEAAVTPHAIRLRGDIAKLESLLRAGNLDTALSLGEKIREEASRLRPLFPGSPAVSPEIDERVGFLTGNKSRLAEIQSRTRAGLRPAPKLPGLSVYATEVPQSLYLLVMSGENPAAVRGDNRPVESITRDDAREFCRRLGWALGTPVRLPSALEFKTIAGETIDNGDAAAFGNRVRAIDNGDGTASEIGAAAASPAGIRNILGNVAEWLETESETDYGRIGGGDAESTLEELRQIPIIERPYNSRSRFVGFRFVVVDPTTSR